LKTAEDTVPMAGGADWMTVGTFDFVSAGIEAVGGTFVEEVTDGLELLIGVDTVNVVMVE
jgi:hypothetical protein